MPPLNMGERRWESRRPLAVVMQKRNSLATCQVDTKTALQAGCFPIYLLSYPVTGVKFQRECNLVFQRTGDAAEPAMNCAC